MGAMESGLRIWDYIKNSGSIHDGTRYPGMVGAIPGKRESRRFEGDYILRQQDIVEQRVQADAVSSGVGAGSASFGRVYSEMPGCTAISS